MITSIHTASTPGDYMAFATLVTEYVEWCRTRYADDGALIDKVFGYQSLETELKGLPEAYGAPNGVTLLASVDGRVAGAGAYRRLADGTCEMKRLFVRTRHGGAGVGRALCEALIENAGRAGHPLMRLDTGHRFTEAIALYRSAGFRECPPYHAYPADIMPAMVFMDRPLLP